VFPPSPLFEFPLSTLSLPLLNVYWSDPQKVPKSVTLYLIFFFSPMAFFSLPILFVISIPGPLPCRLSLQWTYDAYVRSSRHNLIYSFFPLPSLKDPPLSAALCLLNTLRCFLATLSLSPTFLKARLIFFLLFRWKVF